MKKQSASIINTVSVISLRPYLVMSLFDCDIVLPIDLNSSCVSVKVWELLAKIKQRKMVFLVEGKLQRFSPYCF